MDYVDSEPTGYQERSGKKFADDVHIRQEDRGIVFYAVFDGTEQVSEEFGPANDRDCIAFAEGYSRAKQKYNEFIP